MRNMLGRLRTGIAIGACLLVFAPSLRASDAVPRGTVKVDYTDPDAFTDVGDAQHGVTDKERDAILAQLTKTIETRAASRIPAGSTLTITVRDIDRAGDFEPWHGPQANHVRIMRDIYPPRIKLAFSLVDANGRPLTGGDRELLDQAYLMPAIIEDRQDPLRYEKRMLGNWIAREFGP